MAAPMAAPQSTGLTAVAGARVVGRYSRLAPLIFRLILRLIPGLIPRLTPGLILALFAVACAPITAPPGPGLQALGREAPGLGDEVLVTEDGLELPLRQWRPSGSARAVILALHGFNDYSNAFEGPAAFWAERGILTYAYDQRGFGRSPNRGLWPGEAILAADLRVAADAIGARHRGLPLFILGESMGGAVVLTAITGPKPPQADGILLVAPAVWARRTMPWYQRLALWLGVRLFPGAAVTGGDLKIQASDNIDMLRGLSRDPLFIKATRVDAVHGLTNLMDAALAAAPAFGQRALLLYGERDEVVPKAPTFAPKPRWMPPLPAIAATAAPEIRARRSAPADPRPTARARRSAPHGPHPTARTRATLKFPALRYSGDGRYGGPGVCWPFFVSL